jgi:hypothetical protein
VDKKALCYGFIDMMGREFGLAKAPVSGSHFLDVERGSAIPSVFDMGNDF